MDSIAALNKECWVQAVVEEGGDYDGSEKESGGHKYFCRTTRAHKVLILQSNG